MKQVMFFLNGNTAVFDLAGRQIPELQESWVVLFLKFLESQGHNPLDFSFTLPDGRQAKPFRTSDNSWNWEIER